MPYRILNINHKKELLWSLWIDLENPADPHSVGVDVFRVGVSGLCGQNLRSDDQAPLRVP